MSEIRGQNYRTVEVRVWVPEDLRAGAIAPAIVDEGPTWFPVYCAWCQAEGILTRVGWKDCENSSGICARHYREAMRELEEDVE
uniref:Uncharacterized protein n=1 Tax=viral metagenome TaxID=1070528 RepID=A0A6M3ITM3_9ZZZZ